MIFMGTVTIIFFSFLFRLESKCALACITGKRKPGKPRVTEIKVNKQLGPSCSRSRGPPANRFLFPEEMLVRT